MARTAWKRWHRRSQKRKHRAGSLQEAVKLFWDEVVGPLPGLAATVKPEYVEGAQRRLVDLVKDRIDLDSPVKRVESLPPGLLVVTVRRRVEGPLLTPEVRQRLLEKGYTLGPVLWEWQELKSLSDEDLAKIGLKRV